MDKNIRNIWLDIQQQIRENWLPAVVIFAPVVVFLLAILLLNRIYNVPTALLMRDPVSLAELPPWAGSGSNFGVILWCMAMTVCFAAAVFARYHHADRKRYLFLMVSGAFTAFMMLDDFFLLHESFRDYLGFPEQLFYAIYLLVWVGYFALFWRQMIQSDYLLLVLGLFFLGCSLGMDIIQYRLIRFLPFSIYYLVEDGFKILGITGWFGYFALYYLRLLQLKPAVVERPSTPG